MAHVLLSKSELLKLIGKDLPDNSLLDLFAQLGSPSDGIEGDKVDIEVNPNRPDLYSVEGAARALSSFLGIKTGMRKYPAKDSGFKMTVDMSVKKIRPFIAVAVARNVKMDDQAIVSLIALQEKLHDTLGRKRKKLAIGFTDLDKLAPPFSYSAVKPDESPFIPLGENEPWTPKKILEELKQGKEYGNIFGNSKIYPLIRDSKGEVVALPPIITAEKVKVTSQTRNVFIDVTGTHESTVNDALNILCCALADRGAEIFTVDIESSAVKSSAKSSKIRTPDLAPRKATLKMKNANRLLGMEFKDEDAIKLLAKMGIDATVAKKGVLNVHYPPYRTDIIAEVDLIEDLAIAFGYENVPPTLPRIMTIGTPSPKEEKCELIREIMFGLGFTELLSAFLTSNQNDSIKPLAGERNAVEMKNPLTEDFTMLRTWCVPSLLETFGQNSNQKMPQQIFELGVCANVVSGKVVEQSRLSVGVCGPKASFNELRSCLEAVCIELGAKLELKEFSQHEKTFIPGRCADIIVDGKLVGLIGEVHPQVMNNFNIENPVAVFEIQI